MSETEIGSPEQTTNVAEPWTWSSWQVILLLLNASLGLILFEWAWYANRRFRKNIPELDALLPAFRRNDAPKWQKWRFYPGAMTIMIPRFLFGVCVTLFILLPIVKIALIGQPMHEPITGCRRVLIRWAYRITTTLF